MKKKSGQCKLQREVLSRAKSRKQLKSAPGRTSKQKSLRDENSQSGKGYPTGANLKR